MKPYKIISVVLASAMLFTGCSFNKVGTNNNQSLMGNSNGNINNLGSICADDNNLYYQETKDGYNLYKSDLDGNNPVELNNAETYFINCYNNKLYYADASQNYNIFSMDTNGENKKNIIKAAAYYVTVYKDKIYYVDFDNNQNIYSANLDGSNVQKLGDDTAFYLTVYNDTIYYVNLSDGAKIYTMHTNGENKTCIVDTYSGYINCYNDYMYFTMPKDTQSNTGDDTLYKYNLNDGKYEQVLNRPCSDINVYNDRIYYRDIEQKKIFSCDLDGQDIKVEAEEDGVFINIVNDKMVYLVKTSQTESELRSKEI